MATTGRVRPRSLLRAVATAALILVTSWQAAGQQAPPRKAAPQPVGDVSLGGRILFQTRAPLGPFSASDRARAASERLEQLACDAPATPDTLALEDCGSTTDIVGRRVVGPGRGDGPASPGHAGSRS